MRRFWDASAPFSFVRPPILFRQVFAAVDVECLCQRLCGCIRLAAADGDDVIALSNDGLARFRDHAEIAIFQVEMDFLRSSRGKMNALESTQRLYRGPRHAGKFEIELNHFIAIATST